MKSASRATAEEISGFVEVKHLPVLLFTVPAIVSSSRCELTIRMLPVTAEEVVRGRNAAGGRRAEERA